MMEFETFCYLQNHKTGCSFVEKFIRENCAETLFSYKKHAVPFAKDPSKFYFINVREPLDLYLSLFNYGIDFGGEIFRMFRWFGMESFYQSGLAGFDAWLNFLLGTAFPLYLVKFRNRNARQIDEFGSQVPILRDLITLYPDHAPEIGLVTWRFYRLFRFNFASGSVEADHVLKLESLHADLTALVEGRLRTAMLDLSRAKEWIAEAPPVNASTRRDKSGPLQLRRETLDLLLKRESQIYDTYYKGAKHNYLAVINSTFQPESKDA